MNIVMQVLAALRNGGARLDGIKAQLDRIEGAISNMATQAQIDEAFSKLTGEVDQLIALYEEQKTAITDLTAKAAAAAAAGDSAALQAHLDAINAEVAKVGAAIPSVQAPAAGTDTVAGAAGADTTQGAAAGATGATGP